MFQSNFPYANTGIQLALKLSNPSLFGQPSGTWKKHQRTIWTVQLKHSIVTVIKSAAFCSLVLFRFHDLRNRTCWEAHDRGVDAQTWLEDLWTHQLGRVDSWIDLSWFVCGIMRNWQLEEHTCKNLATVDLNKMAVARQKDLSIQISASDGGKVCKSECVNSRSWTCWKALWPSVWK
jgi:hypothetical protein